MQIKETYENTYIIQKSKFIAIIKPFNNEEEFKEYLTLIRKKYYDASHVCFAYRINNSVKFSDDGEPSGTAGKPILNVLEMKDLNNIACLVVRYFGGIKLGASGLLRAYKDSVVEVIDKAELYNEQLVKYYELKVSYDISSKIDNKLRNLVTIENINYDLDVDYLFYIKEDNELNKVIELTNGIKPLFIKEEIILIKV